jgi:parallel beta-helix repeat protein
MKFLFKASLLSPMAILFLAGSPAFSQGMLTPPGAPGPTMKTLNQIEPRTGITNLPVTITQGGSYYLTQSFAQSFAASAIIIATNNVTLDFSGFTVAQTAVNSVAGITVEAAGANSIVQNVLIKNGSVTGFSTGVSYLGAGLCIAEDFAANSGGKGFVYAANGTAVSSGNIVRHSLAGNNTGPGFLVVLANNANTVQDCDATSNQAGFDLASTNNLIIHCRAFSNATNYMIAANNNIGTIAEPIQNPALITGSKSGAEGIGVTDPFSNLGFP